MKNVLVIHSSILGQYSQSTSLLDEFAVEWQKQHPESNIVIRDLAEDELPSLDGKALAALSGNAELTDEQKAIAELSLRLIDELKSADHVAIAVPMYNFGVPVQLKKWFDLICRAGITFKYSETGPEGLLTGKKALLVATTGGVHRNTATDLGLLHTQTILGFVGLTDVNVAYAEGLAMGQNAKDAGLSEARKAMQAFVLAN